MAIITNVPGIEVAIVVDGEDLPESEAPSKQLPSPIDRITTSAFFEAEADQSFQVQMLTTKPYQFITNTLCYEVVVDGRLAAENVLTKKTFEQLGGRYQMYADCAQEGRASDAVYTRFEAGQFPGEALSSSL